ncbi:MAG: efflux RND transporter periplasmic adaptor subunit [Chloroflexota bacterium]
MLPASRTQQTADEEATPTPIPTAIVPTKPTYTVKKGEIIDQLEFSGRISAVTEEDLFFRSSGRVRNLFFKRDALVTAGTVIADLEIDDLERELISVNLDLERAQSRLDSAERDLSFEIRTARANLEIAQLQLSSLRRQVPVNLEEIAMQEVRVELNQIQLEKLEVGVDPLLINDVQRAELQVQKLESAIKDSQIIAPFDGLLKSVSLVAGQGVDAYKNVTVIADVSSLEVSADLISSQLDGLAEGMVAEVVLVSRPGVILEGDVRRLPFPYGSGASGTTVEDLDKSTRIALSQSAEEAGYKDGDLVRVTVELERKEDVLWLPPQALRNFDGRRFAVIQDGDTQRRVDVTVGIQTPEMVELEEGLEEGQTVIGQ